MVEAGISIIITQSALSKQYSRLTQDIEQGKNLHWRRSSSYQPDLGILLAELNGDFT